MRQVFWAGVWLLAGAQGAIAAANPVLQIGIVQRFGEQPGTLELKAQPGDRLTVKVDLIDRWDTLTGDRLVLQPIAQPLPKPAIDERVVLGTYRSFETAEAAANQWRSRGIQVELAQPSERWQVWAKREVYNQPLLRRLLLESIQANPPATTGGQPSLVSQRRDRTWFVRGTIGGKPFTSERLEISAGKGTIEVGRDRFAGSLKLQRNAYGSYTIVNAVPTETYLRGVVPYEIGAGAPESALQAQAILARTYALRNLRRFAIDGYQLCADTHCQVYRGLKAATARVDRAIAATNGQVLTYQNELIDALYFSTSGGVTANFTDVWDGPDRPYLRPVVDAHQPIWDLAARPLADERNLRQFLAIAQGWNELGWRDFRWRKESTLPDIAQGLQRYCRAQNSDCANLRTVQSLTVTERSPGGRVRQLTVATDRGPIVLEKDAVRSAFMAPRSTLFYLEPIGGGAQPLRGYAFVGGGWGHGAGLSQAGSQKLAQLGWNASRILQFYYPGTQLQPMSDRLTLWRDPELK